LIGDIVQTKTSLTLIFILISSIPAFALEVFWDNDAGDNLWSNNMNWSMDTLPDITIGATLNAGSGPDNGPLISGIANALEIRLGGPGGGTIPTTLRIVDGAVLTTANWLMIGTDSPSIRSGALNMTGGTVILGTGTRLNGHLFVPFGITGSSGYLKITGGTIDVGALFSISNTPGTSGKVELLGGTIVTNTFQMAAGASLEITQGTLIISGNQTALVNSYIADGWITAYGGNGSIVLDYDITTPGKTTVKASSNSPYARFPSPSPAESNVPANTSLTWTSGDYAAMHNVYLGTDYNQVLNANNAASGIYKTSLVRSVNTYNPVGLEFGKTYYWRIDEVNGTDVWTGPVWQFSTASYLIVENFQSYNDTAQLKNVWHDGSDSSSGSSITLSTTIGHEQNRSLVFDYNNTGAFSKPCFSEISCAEIYPNWTIASIAAIDIWYKGNASNASQLMYVVLEDSQSNLFEIQNSDINAAKNADWTPWRIALFDFTGVNLTDIKKIYIGFGDRTNPQPGGTGTICIDDIQLHPRRCLYPPITDLDGDKTVNFTDFAVFAEKWLMHTTPEL